MLLLKATRAIAQKQGCITVQVQVQVHAFLSDCTNQPEKIIE